MIVTKPWAYYNDFDPDACDLLEELIRRGAIAPGEVDRRSILDVQPKDVKGFAQCHWFAGIGGWSYALRLAGWPDDEPVWTGSPPCQPFSAAGRRKGKDDERHLGPKFASLVWACCPPMLFGEQVASADVFGKAAKKARNGVAEAPAWAWLDDLLDRLEAARYTVGASDLPSASIGAPHIRQRTHFGAVSEEWLANADNARRQGNGLSSLLDGRSGERPELRIAGSSPALGLEHTIDARLQGLAGDGGDRAEPGWIRADAPGSVAPASILGGMADADGRDSGAEGIQRGREQRQQPQDSIALQLDNGPWPGPTNGFWATADWLFCRDGKWRPVEARSQQMVDGLRSDLGRGSDLCADETDREEEARRLAQEEIGFPLGKVEHARSTRLRGYGNAINPHVAAHFIVAFIDALRGGAATLHCQSPLELVSLKNRDVEDLL